MSLSLLSRESVAARAFVYPDPHQSTWEIDDLGISHTFFDSHAKLTLVGTNGSVADSYHQLKCTLRDQYGNLLAGVPLDINFTPNAQYAICQSQPYVTYVSCALPTGLRLRQTSDANGVAIFRVVGGSNGNAVPQPISFWFTVSEAELGAGGDKIAVLDLDGAGGAQPADYSQLLNDFFSGLYYERSDFNFNGVLDPGDLSQWQIAFFGGGSAVGCSAGTCP